MSHELICSWLGLPPGDWPPDHYRLLDLDPAVSDPARIEQQAHERMEVVHRYQLLYPELVVEAKNRLVQAYICLTDPDARRAYDAARFGRPKDNGNPPPPPIRIPPPAPPAPPLPVPAAGPIPQVESPPVAVPAPPAAIPVEAPVAVPAVVAEALPVTPPPVRIQPRPKVDPAIEASHSHAARRGLGTRRALYQRLARTRRLMRAWEAAGKYLGQPKGKLSKPSEATELINRLKALRDALEAFPPLLGEAGQPGYSVVVLVRQTAPVPIFQTLLPSQRETLAQHWKAGRQFLQAHRDYLREEIRTVRRRGTLGRALHAVRRTINDNAGAVALVLLALLAIIAAIWRQFVNFD